MSKFDLDKFKRTKFVPRTAEIKLPSLSDYFEGEAVFTVRGMTAAELALCNDAVSRNHNFDIGIGVLTNDADKIQEIRNAIGLADDNTPDETVRRLEQLVICSVEPKLDRPAVLKLAETFPIEFYQLTNKISELTGMGMDIKKPEPSGEIVQ